MPKIIHTTISFNCKFSDKDIKKKLNGATNLCEWVMPEPANMENDKTDDWKIENWGDKWGASYLSIDNGTIDFQSAWTPPHSKIMQMICNKFGKPFDHMKVDEDDDTLIKTYKPIKKETKKPKKEKQPKPTCDTCASTACHSCNPKTFSLWTPLPLPEKIIRNNIMFLELLGREAFKDGHPALQQMIKEMKSQLKGKK